jgi:hypothetical protein
MSLITPLLSIRKIPISKDDDGKHNWVKLEQVYNNDTKKETVVPVCYGDNIEKLLVTIREFRESITLLDYDTGNECYNSFRHCLKVL